MNSPDTVELYVNGTLNSVMNLTSLNESWNGTVSLTGYADSVWVKLTDQFGRVAYDTIQVNYFDTISIAITYPENNHDTNIEWIEVRGTTMNTGINDTVLISVSGTNQDTYILTALNGTWSGSIQLSGLGETVVVELTDRFGSTAYDTIMVNYYDAISVAIVSPVTGHDTNLNVIGVTGTTSGSGIGDTVTIYNDATMSTGVVLTAVDGIWSGTVSLGDFGDTVWVELTDRFGRTNWRSTRCCSCQRVPQSVPTKRSRYASSYGAVAPSSPILYRASSTTAAAYWKPDS